jgi:hypothetical protein
VKDIDTDWYYTHRALDIHYQMVPYKYDEYRATYSHII